MKYLHFAGSSLVNSFLQNFGNATGPIWLSDINCYRDESKVTDCSADPVTTSCSHYVDVGVTCINAGKDIFVDNLVHV